MVAIAAFNIVHPGDHPCSFDSFMATTFIGETGSERQETAERKGGVPGLSGVPL
jgi:hypothetical protein